MTDTISKLAKVAYTEYAISLGDVNRGGGPLTPWEELEIQYRRAWSGSVKAVLVACAAEQEAE